ncbi:alpha/beta hydrolase [Rhodococcus fascians]|nr:alpha/beta hydrolase [Rhodococcus fascians]
MSDLGRRRFLAWAGVSAGASVVAACSSVSESSNTVSAPTFVLVGGSAAPSFFWTPLVRELAVRGARALPVELPGHGLDAQFPLAFQSPQDAAAFGASPSPVVGRTLDDYAGAVVTAVEAVREHGPVVLVGHSLGGPVITRAADSLGDSIAHLVYISAIAVSPEGSALGVFAAPENAGSLANSMPPSLGDIATTGVTRTNLRSADATLLDSYRAAVMADVPEDQLLAALNYLQQPDESVLPTLEDIAPDPEKWGRISRTFVRLTADRFHTVPLQDKMISDADAMTEISFRVRDIDSSHAGFIVTQPGSVADVLLDVPVS